MCSLYEAVRCGTHCGIVAGSLRLGILQLGLECEQLLFAPLCLRCLPRLLHRQLAHRSRLLDLQPQADRMRAA